MGLKAASHPTGILPGDCDDFAGDAGQRRSSGHAVRCTVGKRSPLSARFTTVAGCDVNMLVLGNDGNEIRLAPTSASNTAPTRTQNIPRIGFLSETYQLPHVPEARPTPARATGNADGWRRFPTGRRPHPLVIAKAHTCVMSRWHHHCAELSPRTRLIVGTGHPFPLPPCLAGSTWAQPMDRSAAP
jgi:hypothetical protein